MQAPAEYHGPSFLSSSFSLAAAALEQPLVGLLAAKDKKAGEAALAALRVQRRKAQELELSLLADWSAWTESIRDASAQSPGSLDPLVGYDRAAHAAKLVSMRSAEDAALAEARGIVNKASGAKGFNASALRLLGDYESALELPQSLRAGAPAMAAFKADGLKDLLAAALCARPRLYFEALSVAAANPGIEGMAGAAEAFRSALFEGYGTPASEGAAAGATPDSAKTGYAQAPGAAALKAELEAALALASKAGERARLLGLCYTGGDFYGFLSVLLLARPSAERASLMGAGIIPSHGYGALGSASAYTPWPRSEPAVEQGQSAMALYAAWLSARLRNDGLEASRFALLSAAPGLNQALAARAAAPHKDALELSFERYWLEARDALALDLRADALLWLRGMGLRPAPDSVSLDAAITRWPSLALTAGIELALKAEGKSYALPYAAIAASLEASLRSVFGSELPSFVYLEARGSVAEGFHSPPERSSMAMQAMGEDLHARYGLGMAWSLEAWMEPYLKQSARMRGLASLYARTAAAARIVAEPWYAALSPQFGQGMLP